MLHQMYQLCPLTQLVLSFGLFEELLVIHNFGLCVLS